MTTNTIGQKNLFAAILKQAIRDAYSVNSTQWWDAIHWFRASDDTAWPGSFVNVCDLLGLDHATIRRKVFEQVTELLQVMSQSQAVCQDDTIELVDAVEA